MNLISMDQDPCREAKSCLEVQEIRCLVWDPKINYTKLDTRSYYETDESSSHLHTTYR
jgi:hypothetical protein